MFKSERKRKYIRLLRHQLPLIKPHFDGLSVNDPKRGLNFPRSTHGFTNHKAGDLGNGSFRPSQTPNALPFFVPGGFL